jgi:hypothetical protein
MTIDVDNQSVKKTIILAVWGVAIALGAYAAYRYVPPIIDGFNKPKYAILKTGDLIREYQSKISQDNFILYRDQDLENSTEVYFLKIKNVANNIARREGLIIFDEAAVIGVPSNAIDITPFVRQGLGSE